VYLRIKVVEGDNSKILNIPIESLDKYADTAFAPMISGNHDFEKDEQGIIVVRRGI
jgi:hypothetical protein